eukprot:scaffold10948_cov132-Isochrysis_galbana.AAC.2
MSWVVGGRHTRYLKTPPSSATPDSGFTDYGYGYGCGCTHALTIHNSGEPHLAPRAFESGA